MVEAKKPVDNGVGYIEHPFPRGSDEILSDRELLKRDYPELHARISSLQNAGKEVWGRFNAHKGAVLTIVGATAAAAGIVGIGIYIKREEIVKKIRKR